MSLYDIPVTTIRGQTETLEAYRGKVLLIVNVASRCGFTPQYGGLETLYRKHRERGLVLLGFRCATSSATREPGAEAEIALVLLAQLRRQLPDVRQGARQRRRRSSAVSIPDERGEAACSWTRAIKWNFTKFLVDRQGNVVKRFGSLTKPERLESRIETLLGPA